MIGKFIYVFNDDARDMLIARNYHLLRSDALKKMYVFENKANFTFDCKPDVKMVYSDTLTF